jgi:hypothetical protein
MSTIIGNWLDVSSTSNSLIQTYVYGFVDMSGGNLILRNNNIYVNTGDVSLGGRIFTNSDANFNSRLLVGSDVSIGGRLFVNGSQFTGAVGSAFTTDISTNARLFVNQDSSFNSRVLVGSDISLGGRLFLQGDSNLNGNFTIRGA